MVSFLLRVKIFLFSLLSHLLPLSWLPCFYFVHILFFYPFINPCFILNSTMKYIKYSSSVLLLMYSLLVETSPSYYFGRVCVLLKDSVIMYKILGSASLPIQPINWFLQSPMRLRICWTILIANILSHHQTCVRSQVLLLWSIYGHQTFKPSVLYKN